MNDQPTRSGRTSRLLIGTMILSTASCSSARLPATAAPSNRSQGIEANAGGLRSGQDLSGDVTPYMPDSLTWEDYARADGFLSWNAIKKVSGVTVAQGGEKAIQAHWVPGDQDDRFWYDVQTENGHEFILVNPTARTRGPAFDHARLAALIEIASGSATTKDNLPFSSFTYVEGDSIRFSRHGINVAWTCPTGETSDEYPCRYQEYPPPRAYVLSPDRISWAFVHENNLLVDSADIVDTLTTDGSERYGYGTVPAECCDAVGRRIADPPPVLLPKLLWAPDSNQIVTHRYDERNVQELHLLQTNLGRPQLYSYPYALPGDTALPRYEYHVFNVKTGSHVPIDGDPMVDGFPVGKFPIQWSADSEELFFTRHTPDFENFKLVFANPKTGATRVVVEEHEDTFVDLNSIYPFLPPNWRVVRNGDAVIWFSERSGWGHLYLYHTSLDSVGTDPIPITKGDWLVLNILHIQEDEDPKKEWIYLIGLGREQGVDPYHSQLYRVHFDGSGLERLTHEPANHAIQISPSGKYILDTYSTRSEPSVTVLRGDSGTILMDSLEVMNVDRLLAEGWQMPVHFSVKAADSKTDLHGFLHFPSHFDERYEYPIVDFIYPGPQMGPILTRSFSVQPFGEVHALAELGFIVFTMDARGTPQRSKEFHDTDYGALGNYGLHDHIHALKQLDSIYPQIDLNRVGIYGHSGGGAAAAAALLEYPHCFSVGIAGAGNQDDRSYYYSWGYKYQGSDTTTYADQANQNKAGQLEGKLLITYGTMDDNVHPNGTLLLIDSLIANNRDFDLLVLPNRDHEYLFEPYVIRRGWDYLVRHLLGAEPPTRYRIKPPPWHVGRDPRFVRLLSPWRAPLPELFDIPEAY